MQLDFGIKFLIDFWLILRSIWVPKLVQNEVGNRTGTVIGKKEGRRGAYEGQYGVQDGVILG